MYAQLIALRVPADEIAALRRMIEEIYLPVARKRSGFVAGYLLEQVDDATRAHLVLLWDSYESYEQHRRTTLLAGSEQSIAARMQGLRMERQECIIHVKAENIQTASTP